MSQSLAGSDKYQTQGSLRIALSRWLRRLGRVTSSYLGRVTSCRLMCLMPKTCTTFIMTGPQSLLQEEVCHSHSGPRQALKHGLVLEKVHGGIEFDQSAWLAPYINFNIQLRMKAKNNFKKAFFELMNNSVFGKTMENMRKHKDISFTTNEEAYFKRVMKPNYKSGI